MSTITVAKRTYWVQTATSFRGLCRPCQGPINAGQQFVRDGNVLLHMDCLRRKAGSKEEP